MGLADGPLTPRAVPESPQIAEDATRSERHFQIAILSVCGLATLAWLATFIPIIRAGSRADGFEMIPAFFATPIWAVLVLPAMVLGIAGGRLGLRIAAILLGLAVFAALYVLGG